MSPPKFDVVYTSPGEVTPEETLRQMREMFGPPYRFLGYGVNKESPLNFQLKGIDGQTFPSYEACYVAFRQQVPNGEWAITMTGKRSSRALQNFQFLTVSTWVFETAYDGQYRITQ